MSKAWVVHDMPEDSTSLSDTVGSEKLLKRFVSILVKHGRHSVV